MKYPNFNDGIKLFNCILLIIFTYIFCLSSIFTDNLIFFNLIERIEYKDVNFKDYLCYLNNVAVYPLYLLQKIFGFKISYLFLTATIGVLFTYFVVKIYCEVFQNSPSSSIYTLIFFFYMPFGIGGYYVDQIIYLLSIISLYFFLTNLKYSYIYSAFFLALIGIVKLFHVAPFIISISMIFFYKFLFEKNKYHVIKRAIIFYFSFIITLVIFYSLYLYFNKISINLFYEYQIKQSLFYSSSRFDEFINKFFFLEFNLFKAIINKNLGIVLFYPFIIVFYISLFFLVKNFGKESHLNKNIFLIFMTFSTSINFIMAGRDLNHKILFLPILFFAVISLLNFKSFNKFSRFYPFLTTIVLIIYSSFPINERVNIKDFLSKRINFQDNYLKFEGGKYKNFYYTHRSNFFSTNNIYNITEQISSINNFFINEFSEKNNEYKFIFFDDESLPISSTLNKKNCSPVCANLYKNNPPKYTLSKSIYVNHFKKFYELENAILIVCYINKDKNELCLKKPSEDENQKGSVPGDFNRFIQLQESISTSTEIFATKNFSVYKYSK